MRFSLKTLLITFTLLILGLGWYMMKRRAELGVEFRIAKPIEQDEFYDAPDSIREFTSQRVVGEYCQQLEKEKAEAKAERIQSRLKRLRLSLRSFDNSSDKELLQSYPDEFLQIAKDQQQDTDLAAAINAAWILENFGDQAAYQQVRDRLIAAFSTDAPTIDQQTVYQFHSKFGTERLAVDPDYVEFMKSHSGPEDPLVEACSSFLHKQKIDDRPYQQRILREAKEGKSKTWAFLWLVKNHFTAETKTALREYLDNRSLSSHFEYYTVRHFLEIKQDDPDWIPLRNRIEQSSYEYLKQKDDIVAGNSLLWLAQQTKYWKMLSEHGTMASADFFRDAIQNTVKQGAYRRAVHLAIAVRGLDRLELRADAEVLLKKVLKAEKNHASHSSDYTTIEMLDLAEKFWGPEKTIEICKDHIEGGRCEGACEKLAAMFENTGNESIAKLLASTFEGSPKGFRNYYQYRSIVQIEKIGSELLPDLWKNCLRREHTYTLCQRWKDKNVDRKAFIQWLNGSFQPRPLLTVESVLEFPRCMDEDSFWKIEPFVIRTDHQFALSALALLGNGILIRDFQISDREDVTSKQKQFAKCAQPEFDWASDDTDSEAGLHMHSFVVNERLYQFSILEGRQMEDCGEYYLDNDYPTESCLEILNAVAIRQRLKGRFFLYSGEGLGDFVYLIVYLSGEAAAEMKDKFGLTPKEGFKYYFDH